MRETTTAPLIGWSRASPPLPSRSGRLASSRVRVEVTDQGGPWERSVKEDERNGRGLLVVAQLARNFGRAGGDQAGWTVWFECRDATGSFPGADKSSGSRSRRP